MAVRVSAAQLRAWRDAGLTRTQAADCAGCSRRAMAHTCHRLGIDGWATQAPKVPCASIVQLCAWRDAGLTRPQAAIEAGCGYSAIMRLCRKHSIGGWATHPAGYPDKCRERGFGDLTKANEARAKVRSLSPTELAEYTRLRRSGGYSSSRALAEVRDHA